MAVRRLRARRRTGRPRRHADHDGQTERHRSARVAGRRPRPHQWLIPLAPLERSPPLELERHSGQPLCGRVALPAQIALLEPAALTGCFHWAAVRSHPIRRSRRHSEGLSLGLSRCGLRHPRPLCRLGRSPAVEGARHLQAGMSGTCQPRIESSGRDTLLVE